MAAPACGGDSTGVPPDARPFQDDVDSGGDDMIDAGDDMNMIDAGDDMVDAMPNPTSAQIQAVRDAADGAIDPALPIDNAFVTYTRPEGGFFDPVGFYVQAEQAGPALFVAVDPADLDPVPGVGDIVSFEVTNKTTASGFVQADAISGFTQASTGNDISGLIQDLSDATDLVSAVGNYQSELVTVSGTIASDFAPAGGNFNAAQIDTAGISGDPNFQIRAPFQLLDDLEARRGCDITLNSVPVGQFNETDDDGNVTLTKVQLGAWFAEDITLSNCPGPKVDSAVASDQTTVEVAFDVDIDPTSIAKEAFTITDDADAALAVIAAAPDAEDPRVVILTTDGQTGGTTYTVTVADTVLDSNGTGVDQTANTATFDGFVAIAQVLITEVNGVIQPGTGQQCDMVELTVTADGTMDGMQLFDRDDGFTFPNTNMEVETGEIIIIHFDEGDCNVNSADNEFAEPDSSPDSLHFDTAYDIWFGDSGIAGTDTVLRVVDRVGSIQDAVFLADDSTGTAASSTEDAAAIVASAGEWVDENGGIPSPDGFVDDDFCGNAVLDLDGTSEAHAGNPTIQRTVSGGTLSDNNDKSDWTMADNTWGLLNVATP